VTVLHLRRWLPVAVYVLIPSVLILPILFSGKMLYGADVVSVFHYSRIVIADAFRSGRLPIWDPHVMAGFPMLAEPQNAIFYPPTWLCVLVSAGTFWTLSAWAHLILAGVFAHRWLERGLGLNRWSAMAGSLIFMTSGYISGHVEAGHVNYIWAYPWFPAVLWRLERFLAGPTLKRGVLLSLVLSMLFLAGVPQFVFFAALLTLVRVGHYILGSREGRKSRSFIAGQAVGWLALGLVFCAPQLFPTLELVGQMQRGEGGGTSFFTDYSLSPRRLGDLVFAPDQSSAIWWETCGFVGGAALLLSLGVQAGRHPQRHLWSAVALFAVLLALGDAIPFYPGFVAVVPGAGWFRGPGRYLVLFTVAVVGLAAVGFEVLWTRGPRGLRFLAAGLTLASVVQLGQFAMPCFRGQDEINLRLSEKAAAWLRNTCGLEGRVSHATESVTLIGKCQAAGIDFVSGYEPMMLRRYAEVMNVAQGAPHDRQFVIQGAVAPHPVVDMLATRVRISYSEGMKDYPHAMSRTWLVNNAAVAEEKIERLQTLAKGPWDPRKTVLLEAYPTEAPPVTTEKSAGKARVVSRGPGRYVIETENDADAYLVLSEAYYPGWTAEVDGKAAEVLPANHLIQTIRLPAGKHLVRFEYRSRFLGLGFAVAALAALLPVGLLVRRHRRELALQRLPGAP